MSANKTLLWIFVAAPMVLATGSISGTVVDPMGAHIPRAEVTLRSSGYEMHTQTNEAGGFLFSGLEAGSYSIEVAVLGFQKFAKSGLYVGANPIDLGNVTMQVRFSAPCYSQPAPQTRIIRGTPGIEGRISTMYGVSPSEVTIMIGNGEFGHWFKAATNIHGRFVFAKIPPGSYYLSASVAGHVGASFYGIVVPAGKKIRIVKPLTLPPCPTTGGCDVLCL